MKFLISICSVVLKLVLLIIIPFVTQAQNGGFKNYERSNPLLGIHFSETNYPNSPQGQRFTAGYQMSFINGLKGKYDYMISAGSSSPNFSIVQDKNVVATGLSHNLNLIALRRFFSDNVRFNPFLNTGIGGQYYNNKLSPTFMLGGGLKIRLAKNIFFLNQANYNFNSSIYNSYQLNFGILGTIKHRAKRQTVTIVNIKPEINIDTDGDGIFDKLDSCPTIKGNIIFHGCPDSDGDGIPDKSDSCKNVPGFKEFNGCPIPSDSIINTVRAVPIKTSKNLIDSLETYLNALGMKIHFASNKSTITDSSLHIISEIAGIMEENSDYDLIVNGHTDSTGNHSYNERLSILRSEAVKNQLIKLGIKASRIQTFGLGATQPITDNRTPGGRKQNRRTEFKIQVKEQTRN